jgi:hypothetical protein
MTDETCGGRRRKRSARPLVIVTPGRTRTPLAIYALIGFRAAASDIGK